MGSQDPLAAFRPSAKPAGLEPAAACGLRGGREKKEEGFALAREFLLRWQPLPAPGGLLEEPSWRQITILCESRGMYDRSDGSDY